MSDNKSIERPPIKTPESRPSPVEQEKVKTPESDREQAPGRTAEKPKEAPKNTSEDISGQTGSGSAPTTPSLDSDEERRKKVESIMSKGLEKVYLNMSEEERMKFKEEGEKTAEKINVLLKKAKVKVKKIFDLLKKWLSMLPGSSKFFIEQEAKIRADKISKLKK